MPEAIIRRMQKQLWDQKAGFFPDTKAGRGKVGKEAQMVEYKSWLRDGIHWREREREGIRFRYAVGEER